MYYDAHTHLNTEPLYEQWQGYLKAFTKIGGKGLVNIGMNHEANKRGIEIAKESWTYQHDSLVKTTLGVHPYEIAIGNTDTKEEVDRLCQEIIDRYEPNKHHIVGIGECGIDAHYDKYNETKDLQYYAFQKQCIIATELDLPIIIHSRDQFNDTFEVIKDFPDLNIYFHCRGYGPQQLIQLTEHLPHLRVGFCGNLTYPKAELLRESFSKALDLQKQGKLNILLETDAPYLSPQTHRGKMNQPAYLIDLYYYCSQTFSIDMSHLQKLLRSNRQKLYKMPVTS